MLMCLVVSLVVSVGVNEIVLKMDSNIRLIKILKILTDYLRQLELRCTTGAIRRLEILKRMMMIVSSQESSQRYDRWMNTHTETMSELYVGYLPPLWKSAKFQIQSLPKSRDQQYPDDSSAILAQNGVGPPHTISSSKK